MMWLWMGLASAAEPAVDGTWVLAETPTSLEAKHEAALEAGVAQLPWAIRGIARSRLAKPISNCTTLVLDLEPSTFQAQCDDEPALVRPRAGGEPVTGRDGKPYEVTVKVADVAVELEFSGEDGGQRTRYLRQGDRLLLTKQILSSWFEKPVRWTVAYEKR